MKRFTIFEEYYDLITLLNEKEQGELLLAITKYMFENIEPDLNDKQMKIFKNLKRPLDKSKEQSKRRTKKEPNQNQKETKKKPEDKPNENTSMMSMSMSMSNVNVLKNKKEVAEGKKSFVKPTIDEIKSYCKERNNNINPETFYDFYESKGWKVGNQSMKDWKACVRTWEKRTKKEDVPEWFDKDIESEKTDNKELEELIKKYE